MRRKIIIGQDSYYKSIFLLTCGLFFLPLVASSFTQYKYVEKNGEKIRINTLTNRPYIKAPHRPKTTTITNAPYSKKIPSREIASDKIKTPKQQASTVYEKAQEHSTFSDSFYFGVHTGADYLSIDQSQTLGAANVGVLLPLNFQISTGFTYQDISTGLRLDAKKFKYSNNTSSKSKWIHALTFDMAYRLASLRIDLEQSPLFKNDNGTVQMVARTTAWAGLGFKSSWDFSLRKKTSLDWGAWAFYPVTMESNDTAVKVSDVKGYKVSTRATVKREITKWHSHELYYRIEGEVTWEDLEFHAEWGASRGSVQSQTIGASTLLGLELSF